MPVRLTPDEIRAYPKAGRSQGRVNQSNYVVVFERAPRNFSAYVPDLPGCVATGKTREQVERLIREAIGLHLEMMREHKEPIPRPSAWPRSSKRS
jgi:predicted RNase H-like HicB family nuclease